MYNLIEYSSNYSDTTGSLWFYSNDEATNFNTDIGDNVAFKSFVYKAKLAGETEAKPAPNNNSGILILEIAWNTINCKDEFKLQWTRQCVLPVARVDNVNANDDNIIFTIKDAKL